MWESRALYQMGLKSFREQLKMKRTKKHVPRFAKTEQQMPRRLQQ